MVQRRRSRYEMKIQCTIWEWLKQVVSGRDILKWIQGENVSVTERYYQSTRIVNDFIHFIELLLHNLCNTEPYCEWFHEKNYTFNEMEYAKYKQLVEESLRIVYVKI